MNANLFLLVLQASAWTVAPRNVAVGDTTHLTRQFSTAPDVWARLQPLAPSLELEPLGAPRWVYSEGELTVIYSVAMFEPGSHAVVMPDIELVYANGEVRTIVGDTAWIRIGSVLPPGDSAISPRPLRDPLERRRTTLVPVVILTSVTLVGLGGWVVFRRRRARPSPEEVREVGSEEPPIDVWVASGESRAVAAIMADRLREALAERIPDAGKHLHTEECIEAVLDSDLGEVRRQIAEALRALERARFSPAAPGDVLEVVDLAESVITKLESNPAES